MTGYKFKTISIEVTVKANLDVLAIVGLHVNNLIYVLLYRLYILCLKMFINIQQELC